MKTKDQWLTAAFDTLRTHSIDRVRVEVLAKRLRVTKGSFYWHFADRQALLDELLRSWEARSTLQIIEAVNAAKTSAPARLHALFSIVHGRAGAPTIETSIRAWAAVDRHARAVVSRVDARREDYVAKLLTEAGIRPRLSRQRSHLLYLALIGEFSWASSGGPSTPLTSWRALLTLMLTGAQSPPTRRQRTG